MFQRFVISPIVNTVKSDNSIKTALDSKELNHAIHKNNYQMQSIDHLTDIISKKSSEPKSKTGNIYLKDIPEICLQANLTPK